MSESADQEVPTVAIELPRSPGVAIRMAAVSQTVASQHPGECPVCGFESIFQQGQYRREFSEELIGGAACGETLGDSLDKTITSITCPKCRIRYVVESDELFTLREQHLELVLELSRQLSLNVTEGSETVQ